LELKVIDEVVREPLGGAHRNHRQAALSLRKAIRSNLKRLINYSPEELVERRYEKFRSMGIFSNGEG